MIAAIKYNKEMITTSTPITVYSDNITSVFFRSLGEKCGRLFRYSLFLSKCNIETKHIAGKNQILADDTIVVLLKIKQTQATLYLSQHHYHQLTVEFV